MAQLFRKDALENRNRRLWGEVIIARPFSEAAMVGLLVAIVGAAVTTLMFGSYARTEVARGYLTPDLGLVRLQAPQAGIVSDVAVKEGEVVQAGDILMSVVVERATLDGPSAEAQTLKLVEEQLAELAERRALEQRLAELERRRLEQEQTSLVEEHAALAARRRLQDDITASTEKAFADVEELVEKGYISKSEYETRRQAYLTQRQQERVLDQQLSVLERQAEAVRASLERLPSDLADRLARIDSEIAALGERRVEIRSRRAYQIVAPVPGRVTAVRYSHGDTAEPGAPLLMILPEDSNLEAELYVPSRAIGFVKAGQQVRLFYDAFPYQRFGAYDGVVTAVTKTILAPDEASAPFDLTEPAYRVGVSLAEQTVDAFGEPVPLQPGMTLEARIVLERQSLLAWLLAPWRAVRGRS